MSAHWILGPALGFAGMAALYLVWYERVSVLGNEIVHSLLGGIVVGIVQSPHCGVTWRGRSGGSP